MSLPCGPWVCGLAFAWHKQTAISFAVTLASCTSASSGAPLLPNRECEPAMAISSRERVRRVAAFKLSDGGSDGSDAGDAPKAVKVGTRADERTEAVVSPC